MNGTSTVEVVGFEFGLGSVVLSHSDLVTRILKRYGKLYSENYFVCIVCARFSWLAFNIKLINLYFVTFQVLKKVSILEHIYQKCN